ncbi:OTU domain-containing protein 7B-like isoform X1 [Malaya genurostris]|uniref:OTU domain-containing protein 7B-like isoform X1 n=1 Tax=Malaya genurostris TaxID=325434 RepID=UPI0026F3B0C2|nr:OTU domain-containing protein 7B-like isoform X1 [Malaya genurostris]XP_058465070.1 OTU domain-containing protein 7B-like isoform X1 [Malaya genurostris]XP_058465071.1 OTU domain-containing protein 7B-like isoform X1 [Malaya genurostris]XP_058465072.1 OTU domain-containing protein 7B-like isoform X1 [Malaya genurostris]XP_058465074.1 OTU domain-containing protein 7B-like isoform X1 [Malaya genurostris]
METSHLVTEFITHTGANAQDAVSCLSSWDWDLKKALIDYNDTSTTEYFNSKQTDNEILMKAHTSTSSPLPPLTATAATAVLLQQQHHHKQQQQQQQLQHHLSSSPFASCSSYSNQPHTNNGSASLHHPPAGPRSSTNSSSSSGGDYGSSSNRHCHPAVGMGQSRNGTLSLLKPTLTKTDSIDIFDCKKLERGISRATENVNLVSRARQEFEMDFHTHCHEQNEKNLNFIDTPDYTFTLPDLTKYSEEFRKFLEKDLIESSTLNSLEATNRLNWWYDSGVCRKLWPLATTGDGNCLLHAASLAMWGFHDRRLTLRRTLHDILSKEEFRDALYRRWRFQQTRLNKQAGFVFCETEWAKEWEEIVAIASPEPRRNSKCASRRRSLLIEKNLDGPSGGTDDESATYESLEEIHVLALAHILRRTIIVVSDVFLRDMNGEAFSPIPFGGVYLPFEVPSNECHRAPLLLAYDMAHFSALVAMETVGDYPPALVPLVDASNQLLTIQFCIDPGNDFNWRQYDGSDGNWVLTDREHVALLKEYLDIVYAPAADSPDDEIYDDYSDEEYEKKIADGEIVFADENHNSGTSTTNLAAMTASNQSLPPFSPSVSGGSGTSGKSKAAKQLQSVAKQFGSIGKSMSKKLKKNIGSITRIGSKSGQHKKSSISFDKSSRGEYPKFRILCATLKARRHEYQEEMIKNYLECAQERYLEGERLRERKELEKLNKYVDPGQDVCDYEADNGTDLVNCINAGCLNYGTVATSYMCLECYETQRKRESQSCNVNDFMPRYGTGKSKFYTEADMESHDRIQQLPSVRRLNEMDQTLYLSRSTFYNDKRAFPISTSTGQSGNHSHGFSPTERIQPSPLSKNGPSMDFSNFAKQATATSGGIVATVYSPGNTILNRAPAGMCVTLPPPMVSPVLQQQQHQQLPSASSSSGMSSSSSSGSNTSETTLQRQPATASTEVALTSSHYGKNQMCRTDGCKFYGSINTNFYCSKCCQEYNI